MIPRLLLQTITSFKQIYKMIHTKEDIFLEKQYIQRFQKEIL